ncbi:hypothetical protein EJB05_28863, partial [Eragrostis curvula]
MPVLRVTGIDRVQPIQRFMDHLQLLRDRSNLEMCLLDFVGDSSNGDEYVKLWIRHALLCQVRKLIVADSCNNNDPGNCEDASCHSCYGIGDGGAGSVLLSGFSAARSLKLVAEPKMKQKPKSLVPSKAIFNSVDELFLHWTILRELKSNVTSSMDT